MSRSPCSLSGFPDPATSLHVPVVMPDAPSCSNKVGGSCQMDAASHFFATLAALRETTAVLRREAHAQEKHVVQPTGATRYAVVTSHCFVEHLTVTHCL